MVEFGVASPRPSASDIARGAPPPEAPRARGDRIVEDRRGREGQGEARRRSRTAYRGLGRRGAIEVARDAFGSFLLSPTWQPLVLPPGARVASYVGPHAARVDVGLDDQSGFPLPAGLNGRHVLVESTLPLRAENEAAQLVPVDIDLAPVGQHFTAPNPLVPVQVGRRLGSGIHFSDINTTLTPVGARDDDEGGLVSGKPFYANATGADTDFLVQPIPAGVELLWHLRSVESPETLRLRVDGPDGTRLTRDASGMVEVAAGDRTLAAISAPRVYDADHARVPASHVVEGEDVVIRVPHASGDWKYPLLVDPEVAENQDNWDTGIDRNGWVYDSNRPDLWTYNNGYGNWGTGLYLYPQNYLGHTFFPAGSWSEWHFPAPFDVADPYNAAYVYRAEFYSRHHAPSTGTACTTQGIYSWGLWDWQRGRFDRPWQQYYHPSPSTVCHASQYASPNEMNYEVHCAGASCEPGAGTPPNTAVMQLNTPWDTTASITMAYLRGARVFQYDRAPPKVTSVAHSHEPPAGWVEHFADRATVNGYDAGLGLKYFDLLFLGPDGNWAFLRPTQIDSCAGDRNSRCPHSASRTFEYSAADLPAEGINWLFAVVWDFIPNGAGSAWSVKVDRTPPSIEGLSGPLWDHRNQATDHRDEGLYNTSYKLHVRATDGVRGGGGSAQRSGVGRIALKVNGIERDSLGADQGCTGDSCPLEGDLTLDLESTGLPDGDYQVTVTATDKLGHETTSAAFQVTVDRRGDVYEASEYTANPAMGGRLVSHEWARLGTFYGRRESGDEVATRGWVACDPASPESGTCDEFRSKAVSSQQGESHTSFVRHTGSREHDPDVPRPITLTEADADASENPERGALRGVLEPWQTPPPNHSEEYVLLTATLPRRGMHGDDNDDSGSPDGEVTHSTWLDARTRLPVRAVGSQGGEVFFEQRWTYRRSRYETAELPPDHFSVQRPAHVDHEEAVDYRGGRPAGPQNDTETQDTYQPQSLGVAPVLPNGKAFCLSALDLVRLADAPHPPSREPFNETWIASDPDRPDAPGDFGAGDTPSLARDAPHPDALTETFSVANYQPTQNGVPCVPGAGDPTTAPLHVTTMAGDSSLAAAHRRAHRDAAEGVQTTPLHEDSLRAGVQPVVLGASVATAWVVTVSSTDVSAFIDVANVAVIVQGPFSRADLPFVASLLEAR